MLLKNKYIIALILGLFSFVAQTQATDNSPSVSKSARLMQTLGNNKKALAVTAGIVGTYKIGSLLYHYHQFTKGLPSALKQALKESGFYSPVFATILHIAGPKTNDYGKPFTIKEKIALHTLFQAIALMILHTDWKFTLRYNVQVAFMKALKEGNTENLKKYYAGFMQHFKANFDDALDYALQNCKPEAVQQLMQLNPLKVIAKLPSKRAIHDYIEKYNTVLISNINNILLRDPIENVDRRHHTAYLWNIGAQFDFDKRNFSDAALNAKKALAESNLRNADIYTRSIYNALQSWEKTKYNEVLTRALTHEPIDHARLEFNLESTVPEIRHKNEREARQNAGIRLTNGTSALDTYLAAYISSFITGIQARKTTPQPLTPKQQCKKLVSTISFPG